MKRKYKFSVRSLVTIHATKKQLEDNGPDPNMNIKGARWVDKRSFMDGEESYQISGYWFPVSLLKEFKTL